MKSVLLIEDDSAERQVISRALESFADVRPEIVSSSKEALERLRGERHWQDRGKHPLPIVIILDLQLGNPSGLEVLEWLKSQDILRRIPVIGVCTPFSQEVVNKAYDFHINCAVARRLQAEEFSLSVNALLNFWLNVNKPPTLDRELRGTSIIDR